MRKPEQRFWDWLRNNRILPGQAYRVENSVHEGMPDVVSLYNGLSLWFELKAEPGEIAGLLLDSQKRWMAEAAFNGCQPYVLRRTSEWGRFEAFSADLFVTELKYTLIFGLDRVYTKDISTIRDFLETLKGGA